MRAGTSARSKFLPMMGLRVLFAAVADLVLGNRTAKRCAVFQEKIGFRRKAAGRPVQPPLVPVAVPRLPRRRPAQKGEFFDFLPLQQSLRMEQRHYKFRPFPVFLVVTL